MAVAASTIIQSEDTDLVRRCLAGEDSAFTMLVTKYRRQVYAIAFRFTGNHEEADDLVQDTFIKAYQHLNGFRGEAAFKTWLFRITTNLSINANKSSRVSKDSGQEPDEHWRAQSPRPIQNLIDQQRQRELYQAIAQLPPKQKQTLMLKTFGHMTCEEVASIMKCSSGTVKANVFNALKRLKTILNPGGVA